MFLPDRTLRVRISESYCFMLEPSLSQFREGRGIPYPHPLNGMRGYANVHVSPWGQEHLDVGGKMRPVATSVV